MPKVSEAFTSDSAYLKQADIGQRRVAVTIESISRELIGQGDDQEEKWVLHFQNASKGMALNKTNAETIAEILKDEEMDHWVGHKIVLYVDPKVMMGGKKVGGIRVMAYNGNGPRAVPAPAPPPPPEITEGFQAGDDDVPF